MAASREVLCVLAVLGILFVAAHCQEREAVSEICLGCMCEAISNCNRTLQCTGDVCGLFRMTWGYWADAGKPLFSPQDDPNGPEAYPRCANDPICAGKAVTGYMNKFAQDCNGDGKIDCYDYAAIHRLGGYGCSGALDAPYREKFINCQRQVQPYLNG